MTAQSTTALNDQAWYRLPDGTPVIVNRNLSEQNEYLGAVLYTEDEWESETTADYEAQADDRITFQGEDTGWTTSDLVLVGEDA